MKKGTNTLDHFLIEYISSFQHFKLLMHKRTHLALACWTKSKVTHVERSKQQWFLNQNRPPGANIFKFAFLSQNFYYIQLFTLNVHHSAKKQDKNKEVNNFRVVLAINTYRFELSAN